MIKMTKKRTENLHHNLSFLRFLHKNYPHLSRDWAIWLDSKKQTKDLSEAYLEFKIKGE